MTDDVVMHMGSCISCQSNLYDTKACYSNLEKFSLPEVLLGLRWQERMLAVRIFYFLGKIPFFKEISRTLENEHLTI